MNGPQGMDHEVRPPDDELDRMYRRLLDELHIPENKRGSMLAQPMHMKWKLLSKHQRYVRVQSTSYGSYNGAVRCVEQLDRMLLEVDSIKEEDLIDFRMQIKDDPEWIQVFLEVGGLNKLTHLLDIVQERRESRMQLDLLEVLNLLIKTCPNTLNLLFEDHDAMTVVALCVSMDCTHIKLSSVAIEILIAAIRTSGYGSVLAALDAFRAETHEELRYVTLVELLKSNHELATVAFKTKVLWLINLLISGSDTLEDRMAVRTDFTYLGIHQTLCDLEGLIQLLGEEAEHREDLAALEEAVNEFRTLSRDDNASVLEDAPSTGSWLSDPEVLFQKIFHVAKTSGSVRECMELLHALLVLPQDPPMVSTKLWALLADTCQYIVSEPRKGLGMTYKDVEANFLSRDNRFTMLLQSQNKLTLLEEEMARKDEEIRRLEKQLEQEKRDLEIKHKAEIDKLAATATSSVPVAAAVDKTFETYAKMKKMGLAEGAIVNKMNKDGLSEADQQRYLAQLSSGAEPCAVKTQQIDGKFAAYAKMKKMGLPEGAIVNKMNKDGLSQTDQQECLVQLSGGAPPPPPATSQPKVDERFNKYANMKKMGLPEGAIRNKMVKDGLNESDQALATTQIFGSGDIAKTTPVVVKPFDPKFEKYTKMKKAGLPEGAVINAMTKDGISQKEQDQFLGKSEVAVVAAAPLDPKFDKYVKMRKAKLPQGAIRNAMIRDKLTEQEQETFFNTSDTVQQEQQQEEPAVKDKPKVQPRMPMKPLFWSKLPSETVDGSIWVDLDETKIDFNIDALEENFAQVQKRPKESSNQEESKEQKSGSGKKEKLALIDPMRAQNAGIAFAKFKMTPQMLKICIQDADIKRLGGGVDSVNMLKVILPTNEEQETLKAYTGDPKDLGKIEALFLELSSIPKLEQRIKAWTIQLKLKIQVAECHENALLLSKACKQISDSTALRQTLKVILAIGNYMNGTTSRGGAYGFKLDIFSKIQNLKSSDQKSNLLKYIVREVAEKKHTIMLNLPKELDQAPVAARISLSAISADVKRFENDLVFVKNLASKEEDQESTFAVKMNNFVSDVGRSLKNLQAAGTQAEELYKNLLKIYAAEDEEFQKDSEKFFAVFDDFIKAFQRELTPSTKPSRKHTKALVGKAKSAPPAAPAADPMLSIKAALSQRRKNRGVAS